MSRCFSSIAAMVALAFWSSPATADNPVNLQLSGSAQVSCPNGQTPTLLAGSLSCPSPAPLPPVDCLSGPDVPAGQVCPPVHCPDGTTVPDGQTCKPVDCISSPDVPNGQTCPPVHCPDGSTVPDGQQCPVVPPQPTTPCKDGSTRPNCEPVDIGDNFPVTNAIEPAASGTIPPISGDPVGAFRIVCPPDHVAKDDPIVVPGQPGGSPHLHSFGVNSKTDANSTYASLRTTGGGCNAPEAYAVYRSAFWFPSMLDGAGNVVLPDYFNTYYKQLPASHPDCKRRAKFGCVALPNSLRFIEGWNPVTMTGKGYGYFECWVDDNTSGNVPGTTRSFGTFAPLIGQGCKQQPNGKWPLLIYQTDGPECWSGDIDSADHRSHVGHASTSLTPGGQGNSPYACDAAHPYLIPLISIREVWTTDANFVAGKWRFACDNMTGDVPGSCGHFDYWEAWSPAIKALWQKNCIDGHKSCNGGELGDGTQIKGMVRWPKGWRRHVLVPLSSVPAIIPPI